MLFRGAVQILKETLKDKSSILIGIKATFGGKIRFMKPINENIVIWDKLKLMNSEIEHSMKE